MEENLFKMVLLGEKFVGKTALAVRTLRNTFDERYKNTIGAAFGEKNVVLEDNQTIMIRIWDTCGDERFHSIGKFFYRQARIALLCYDLSDLTSLNKLPFWIKELRDNEPNCLIYFCGNKMDLQDPAAAETFDQRIAQLAHQNCILTPKYKTSAKTGENIETMMREMAIAALENPESCSNLRHSQGFHLDFLRQSYTGESNAQRARKQKCKC